MPTLQQLASQLFDAFEIRTRDNGDQFVALRDGSPEWMREACHAAHGDMLPDDWRYAAIRDAAAALAGGADPDDGHEFADNAVEPYNADRIRWLASHLFRVDYCDEAAEEYGGEGGMIDRIGWGQYREASEVWALLVEALRDLEADDEDASDDEA